MIISIIVPFYNGNAYMKQIYHQFIQNKQILFKELPDIHLEMIIINDSPNITVEITKHPDIHIFANEKNYGIHQTRINGLKYSHGEYVIFLDQDDYISDNYVLNQYQCLKNNEDIVVCNAIEEKNNLKIPFYKSIKHQECVKTLKWYLCTHNQILSPGQCLIKKSQISEFWIHHPIQINGADDLLLWVVMLLEKKTFAINPKGDYIHVDTGNNVSNDLTLMNDSKINVYNILKDTGLLKRKQGRKLKRCIKWREYYYGNHNKIFKILYSLFYIDLVFINIHYQLIKRKMIK